MENRADWKSRLASRLFLGALTVLGGLLLFVPLLLI
jgi:hypothetical protein